MSEHDFLIALWAMGSLVLILALPFMPRKEVNTPIKAIGFVIVFGGFLPIFILFALVKYLPYWYLHKWIEYREFIAETKVASIQNEFNRKWDQDLKERMPEIYERQKNDVDFQLKQLDIHLSMLSSKKYTLERKIENP
jgi:hypothetical protein